MNITLLIWPELLLSFTGGHVLRSRRSTCSRVPAEKRCFDNLFALASHAAFMLYRFCIFRADCYNDVSSRAVRRHDQAGLLSVPCRDSKHRWRSSDDGGRRHAGRPFQWSTCYQCKHKCHMPCFEQIMNPHTVCCFVGQKHVAIKWNVRLR